MRNLAFLCLLLTALSACSSMNHFIADIQGVPYEEEGSPPSQRQPANYRPRPSPLNPRLELAVSEAKSRWPWAHGSQLRRRAQILSRNPSPDDMALLDSDSTARAELEVLSRMEDLRISGLLGP